MKFMDLKCTPTPHELNAAPNYKKSNYGKKICLQNEFYKECAL